ncbi:MAG: DnaJ- protein scj1 [Sclerophora amabilis]|nr:MAG: DnaJ- protein scj1 [Sclerophora amabilis]
MLLLRVLLALLVPLAFCAEDFYKLLGIDKRASEKDIKRAYRTLSKKFHPDKNPGDETAHQKFVEIAEAYEALSNAETRRIYDQYGHEGLSQHKQGGGAQHHDPYDLFSRFFGGGGHFGHGGGQRRGPNMELRVQVPLRDFYNGKDLEFSLEKQMICEECEGTGSADGEVETCTSCGGRGAKIQKHMLAPGIFQQMQTICDVCGGKGQRIRHPCKVCGGTKVARKVATHTLHIEPGMPKGQRLVYENEADESPDWVAGDLIVQLTEKPAELGEDGEYSDGTFFKRKDRDLIWREVLSVREAWLGDWTRNITHLDGHVVQLSRKRGEVVQPNAVEFIKGEGMPVWHEHAQHDSDEVGALHVHYTVVLPDQMDQHMENDFWELWEKWRKKKGGIDLDKESGRPSADEAAKNKKDEL